MSYLPGEEPAEGVRVKGSCAEAARSQEIRLTLGHGGPGEMEVCFVAEREGIKVHIWNPYTHKWEGVKIE